MTSTQKIELSIPKPRHRGTPKGELVSGLEIIRYRATRVPPKGVLDGDTIQQEKGANTMALIKIESARVVRHVGTRGAFACEEYVTLPDGRSFPRFYTVWHEGTPVEIDGIVAVVGEMSAKTRETAQGKWVADIAVNNPTVTAIGVQALKTVPVIQEQIAANPAPSAEVPF